MEPTRKFYFRVAGETRGPATVEQLRDFAGIAVITGETEIAASASGPWARRATLAICAEVFPARRTHEFGANQFKELNPAAAPPVDHHEIIAHANRPPESFRGREVIVNPALHLTRADERPNEVQLIVQEVGRKVAANAPVVVLPPTPSPFPRWRWFAVAAVLGSAGILSIPLFYEQGYDSTSTMIVGGWTVLLNALLVAVMIFDRSLGGKIGSNVGKIERRE